MGFFNKDKAIIAQNSASVAANLTAAIIAANPEKATTTESALALFDTVRSHIFGGSVALAEEAAQAPGPRAASKPAGAQSAAPATGDPGDVTLTMGKHRGKTLAQVDNEDPTYLTWILEKGTNAELKSAVRAYAESKG